MKIKLLIALFLIMPIAVWAQTKTKKIPVSEKEKFFIPDSLTQTTASISNYILANFDSKHDQLNALFIWVSNNIVYDVDNMFALNFYQSKQEIVDKVLLERKGICMHYAELFTSIANQMGINTHLVAGFTKQNGKVDYIPHAWCVSKVDSVWVLCDPTWGSGYLSDSKYISKTNRFYFMTDPSVLILSHMPFDPMWQLLNHPISPKEFYSAKPVADQTTPYFNFADTISVYEHQDELNQLISSNRRIKKNGISNSLIFDRVEHNERNIEYMFKNLVVNAFNNAVNHYNEGINTLNAFIEYRNQQFSPEKPESEIRKMVSDIRILLEESVLMLEMIKNPDSNMANSVLQLNNSINQAMANLQEQEAFVEKYYATGKLFRKSLFYKYTWMGIPVN